MTKAKKKKLQSYQAYLKLYKQELKPLLQNEWDALIKNLTPSATPPERLVFTKNMAEAYLEGEPDDIKAAVEQARYDNDDDVEIEDDKDSRHKALRR